MADKNYGTLRSPGASTAVKKSPKAPSIADNTTQKGTAAKAAPIQSPMKPKNMGNG